MLHQERSEARVEDGGGGRVGEGHAGDGEPLPHDVQHGGEDPAAAGEVGLQDQAALPLHREDVRVLEGAQQQVELRDAVRGEDERGAGPVHHLGEGQQRVGAEDDGDTGGQQTLPQPRLQRGRGQRARGGGGRQHQAPGGPHQPRASAGRVPALPPLRGLRPGPGQGRVAAAEGEQELVGGPLELHVLQHGHQPPLLPPRLLGLSLHRGEVAVALELEQVLPGDGHEGLQLVPGVGLLVQGRDHYIVAGSELSPRGRAAHHHRPAGVEAGGWGRGRAQHHEVVPPVPGPVVQQLRPPGVQREVDTRPGRVTGQVRRGGEGGRELGGVRVSVRVEEHGEPRGDRAAGVVPALRHAARGLGAGHTASRHARLRPGGEQRQRRGDVRGVPLRELLLLYLDLLYGDLEPLQLLGLPALLHPQLLDLGAEGLDVLQHPGPPLLQRPQLGPHRVLDPEELLDPVPDLGAGQVVPVHQPQHAPRRVRAVDGLLAGHGHHRQHPHDHQGDHQQTRHQDQEQGPHSQLS